MKKVLKILLPLLLVAAVSVAAVAILHSYEPYDLKSVQNDPAAQLVKSFRKTKSMIQSGLAVQMPDTRQNGAVRFDLITKDKQAASSTIYREDDRLALIGTVPTTKGTTDFGLWYGPDDLVFEAPALLEGGAYGLTLSALKEDLKNSPLLSMLGISYDDAAKMIDQFLPQKGEGAEDSDILELLKLKNQLEALLNSCSVTVTEGSVVIYAETVQAYRISYTISPEEICDILDLLASWLTKTESFDLAVKGNAQIAAQFDSMVANLKKQISGHNATAIFDFYLHTESQALMQADCRIDWLENSNAANITATILFGTDPVTSSLYQFAANWNIPDMGKNTLAIRYERTHAHNLPGRMLSVSSGNTTYTVMDIQVNSLNKTFELELFDRKIEISGYWTEEKEELSIYLTLDLGEVAICFLPGEPMPAAPAFTNICKLSQAELEALFSFGEQPMPKEKTADVSVTDSTGYRWYSYFSHKYKTLGEMLVAEEIAVLDEDWRIQAIILDGLTGTAWDVYVDGKQIQGSLLDVELAEEASISILAVKGKN